MSAARAKNGRPAPAAPTTGEIVVTVTYDADGEITGVSNERRGVNAFAAPIALKYAAALAEQSIGAAPEGAGA